MCDLTQNARHWIVTYTSSQKYGSRKILTEYSKINCKSERLDTLLKSIWGIWSTAQRHESCRPKHARTEENVTAVDELVGLVNQEDQTHEHIVQRAWYPARRGTQSSIIHRDVGLKCFFFHLPKRLFAIIISFSYIDISQLSVEMHLRSGGINNTHVIANCLQSEQWKNFENRSIL